MFDVILIATFIFHEKTYYTRPINQMIWDVDRKVKESESKMDPDQAEDMKGNKFA
jgi:hypothetical protein